MPRSGRKRDSGQAAITSYYKGNVKRYRPKDLKSKTEIPTKPVTLERVEDTFDPKNGKSDGALFKALRIQNEKQKGRSMRSLSVRLNEKLGESLREPEIETAASQINFKSGLEEKKPPVLEKLDVTPASRAAKGIPSKSRVPNASEKSKVCPDPIEPLRQPLADIDISGLDSHLFDRSLLPQKFNQLLSIMDGLESANVMTQSRQQFRMRFSEIRDTVSRHARVTFNESDLARLVGIVPEAFDILRIQNKSNHADLEIQLLDPSNAKNKRGAQKLTPRRRLLHKRLFEIVQKAYNEFLETCDEAQRKMWRNRIPWHSSFDIESCPDPPAPATEWPSIEAGKTSVNKRERRVPPLKKDHLDEPSVQVETSLSADGVEGPTETDPQKSLVPVSLLERVRRREQKERQRKESGDDERQRRRISLSRLANLLDSMRSLFANRSRMELNELVNKLSQTNRGAFSKQQIHEQILILTKELPDWASILSIDPMNSKGKITSVFKINDQYDFGTLRRRILAAKLDSN